MSLLIVDDEENTRESLRLALMELGHKTILEAKNGEEALKIVDAEKNRLQMIIADWEMPFLDGVSLADRLGEREDMAMIPFLLITSDLPAGRFAEVQKQHGRIDHAICKPFRVRILNEAIQQAFANRVSRRNVVLWLGSRNVPDGLTKALAAKKNKFLFRDTCDDLSRKDFGVVLLDPAALKTDLQAIQSLRKSTIGSSVSWVCLSREPESIFPVRTLCTQFVDITSPEDPQAWVPLLEQLHGRTIHGWEIDVTSQEVKTLIQQKKFSEAKKALERMLELDAMNSNSHILLADILLEESNFKEAIRHEWRAVEINPCLPKPYIKLMEMIPAADPGRVSEVCAMARNYCPQNTDVLLAAATTLEACGKRGEARILIDYVLSLQPKLEAAQALGMKLGDGK